MKDTRIFHKRIMVFFLVIVMAMSIMTGCANVRISMSGTEQEFTTYEGQSVSMQCALLLLTENRFSYEDMFDPNIWKESVDGVSMDQYVKDIVKDTVEHLLILHQMAMDKRITLTQEEERLLKEASEEYMSTYEETDLKSIQFSEETVLEYYRLLLLAQKVFDAVTSEVDTEVSTDEARMIDVQYLFFSKAEKDDEGNLRNLSENAYLAKQKKAESVREQLLKGEDLPNLAQNESDDSTYYLELGRGEYIEAFETAAFSLEMGEISEVIETEIGCYIIKCINDNVSEDYERRKESIVSERRTSMFTSVYEEYSENAELLFNNNFWSNYSVTNITKGSGRLQEIFDQYFVISTHN